MEQLYVRLVGKKRWLFLIIFWLISMPVIAFSSPTDSLKVVELLKKSEEMANSDIKIALQTALKAQDLAIQSEKQSLVMTTKLHIGKLLFYKGLYNEATNYFLEILKISESIQDEEWMGKAYHQLGNIRLVMEDYDKSISYFDTSERFLNRFYKNKGGIPLMYKLGLHNTKGIIYTGKKNYDLALNEFTLGIDLAEKSKDTSEANIINKMKLYNGLGDLYAKQGQYQKAIKSYNLGLALLRSNMNPLYKAMLLNGLGESYYQLNQYQFALEKFQQGFAIAKKTRGFSHIKHLSEGLYKTYDHLKIKDSALIYLQLFKQYEDSLQFTKTSEKILESELKKVFLQERKKLKSDFRKEKIFFWFLLIAAGSLLIYFLIKIRLQRKKVSTILNENKRVLEEAVKTENEKSILKERVIENEKRLTLLSIQKIENEVLIEKLAKMLPNLIINSPSESNESLEKIKQSLQTKTNKTAITDFEFYFELLYTGFFERLQKHYAHLTANERRLCAFLKLQMNSKEIASVTGQSLRAVEIARTRLRKKIGITKAEIDLNDFFNKF